jgi:hypothetical protein
MQFDIHFRRYGIKIQIATEKNIKENLLSFDKNFAVSKTFKRGIVDYIRKRMNKILVIIGMTILTLDICFFVL